MTRKDYNLIADAFREALKQTYGKPLDARGVRLAIKEVAAALKRDNGRFDPERFNAACQL